MLMRNIYSFLGTLPLESSANFEFCLLICLSHLWLNIDNIKPSLSSVDNSINAFVASLLVSFPAS